MKLLKTHFTVDLPIKCDTKSSFNCNNMLNFKWIGVHVEDTAHCIYSRTGESNTKSDRRDTNDGFDAILLYMENP